MTIYLLVGLLFVWLAIPVYAVAWPLGPRAVARVDRSLSWIADGALG